MARPVPQNSLSKVDPRPETPFQRFHGLNERISVDNYEKAINFYYHVLMNADRETLAPPHSHGEDL